MRVNESPRTSDRQPLSHIRQALVDDPRVEQVLLPIRDGLTLIRRV
ncbi:hypothetical protein QUB75_12495 [Microcoleus sp. K1-B6]